MATVGVLSIFLLMIILALIVACNDLNAGLSEKSKG
jgi:hypothetical protein